MRVAVLILALVFCAVPRGSAQQGGPQFGGGGPANYNGYAFVECTAANTPAVRLVLLQGVVPAALPATAPRPSLALVLTGSPDSISGKEITLSKDPGGPGQVVSCPVVGSCVPAEKGTVKLEPRGSDGSFKGQFAGTWPPIPERTGKFSVAWRDTGKTCG
jgi:hypothetical protein